MEDCNFLYFQRILRYFFGVTCQQACFCRMSFPPLAPFTKYYENRTSIKRCDYKYRKPCKSCEPLYDNAICASFSHVEDASRITRLMHTDVKRIDKDVFFLLHDIPIRQVQHYGFDLDLAHRFPSWSRIQRYANEICSTLERNLPSTKDRMSNYQAKSYRRFKKRTHYQYLGVLAVNLYYLNM